MNIALFSETNISKKKGTSVYINEVSKNLAKKHNVFLFLPNSSFKKEKKDKHGRKIIYIKNISKNFLLSKRSVFLKNLEIYLDKFVHNNNLDIFHCLYGHYFHFLKKYNKPIYWTCHNIPPNENKPFFYSENLFLKFINSFFFTLVRIKHKYLIKKLKFKKIITPSQYVENIFKEEFNLDSKKIKHINNGVNLKKVEKKEKKKFKKFTILTLAAFKYHKNLHLIPLILENLKSYDFQWIIVGDITDNKYFNKYFKYFKKFILQKKIIIKKNISDIEKRDFFRKSHLYVQLSANEGFGIPLLEAKFYNLNSLSTICGSSKQITKLFGGLLIYNIDTKLIAKKILKIFKSKKKYKNKNVKNLNHWHWEFITNRLNNIYKYDNFK